MQENFFPPEDARLKIGHLSDRYGLTPRSLRFYEEKGLLQPKRVGQARLYSSRDLIRLELVLAGKKLGFSLKEIVALIQSYRAEKDVEPAGIGAMLDRSTIYEKLILLERQKAELESSIGDLKATLAKAGCPEKV